MCKLDEYFCYHRSNYHPNANGGVTILSSSVVLPWTTVVGNAWDVTKDHTVQGSCYCSKYICAVTMDHSGLY